MKRLAILLAVAAACTPLAVDPPAPYGAVPSAGQVEWQRQELIMFYHFGPSTFSGLTGENATNRYNASELVDLFRPSAVDADQWVRVASENGFKEVILTAKHHDGFSLWPSPHSICNVSLCEEPYNVDVVGALSAACAKYGVNLGLYLSPWDKNDPTFGTVEYNNHYVEALTSLLDGTYGKVSEFWFDGNGANRSPYDFDLFNATVLGFNPECVIFSNVGPGCRWVGNEQGLASETSWSAFSPSRYGAAHGALPGDFEKYLGEGDADGEFWIPAETDLSIRPIADANGWFWGPGEKTRSARELLGIYYRSVGRNSIMLLNVPPTTDGVLDPADIRALEQFKYLREQVFGTNLAADAVASASAVRGDQYAASKMLDGDFDSYYAAPDDVTEVALEFTLPALRTFNRLMLQEYIPLGQRVSSFSIEVMSDDSWKPWGEGAMSTIGYKRIILGDTVTASAVRVTVKALACPVLNGFGLFYDPFTDIPEYTLGPDGTVDIGEVDGDAGPMTFRVVIPNTFTSELTPSGANVHCGCTSVDIRKSPVAPGANEVVTITYNPILPAGFRETVDLEYTADSAIRQRQLVFIGETHFADEEAWSSID